MLAALLACGLPAYQAAAVRNICTVPPPICAAAKRGEYGMLPHDILPELGALFAENQKINEKKRQLHKITVQLPLFWVK